MIFLDEKILDAMPKPEYDALVKDSLAYDDVLRRGGHLLANQALQPVHAAKTIRPKGGKMTLIDGPVRGDQRADRRVHPDRCPGSG
jgi:hypothetical protein